MFTDAQIDRIAADLFARMDAAGWLVEYRRVRGKGWHLGWTEKGAAAALLLKQWHDLLHLADDADVAPLLAYVLAHRRRLLLTDGADEEARACLRRYIDAGLAISAGLAPDGTAHVQWTPAGRDWCSRFRAVVGELDVGPDMDRLLVLFQLAVGWAPGADTPIVDPANN